MAYALREHTDLMKRFNPSGPLIATVRYGLSTYRERNLVVRPLGTDAHQGARVAAAGNR